MGLIQQTLQLFDADGKPTVTITQTKRQVMTANGKRTVWCDQMGRSFVTGADSTAEWLPLEQVEGPDMREKPSLNWVPGGNWTWFLLGAATAIIWGLVTFPFKLASYAAKH